MMDVESIASHVADTEARLDRISKELLCLEESKSFDSALVRNDLRRIQGSSNSLGFKAIAELCCTLESHLQLVAVREQPCSYDDVFAACDYIAAHANALQRGILPPSLPDSIELHLRTLNATHAVALAAASRLKDSMSNGLDGSSRQVPKSIGATDSVSHGARAAAGQVKQHRYLVVDDDLNMRRLISKVLEPFGICSLARDGHEAITVFEAAMHAGEAIDGIYLDINMPNMDGHRALEHIRCFEHSQGRFGSAGAKIIVVTSEEDDRHAVRAYKAGCQLFLNKPLRPADLRRSFAVLGILGNSERARPRAMMFLNDARSVGLRDKRGGYQLAEVRWESLTEISLLVDDVSRLRPEEALSVDYCHRVFPAVLRDINPMDEDGRFCLRLELT